MASRRRKPSVLKPNRYPILDRDSSRVAVLEPHHIVKRADVPEHCVFCFFPDVIDEIAANGGREIHRRHSEMGEHSVYEIDFRGRRLMVAHPRIGASVAAASLEGAIALGARKFIACGGAGVLTSSIAVGHLVVPTAAIRDEGTSYHYLPPSHEVKPHPRALRAIKETLKSNGLEYLAGKTWTTDGLYRETRAKVNLRREQGCVVVEMEAAAFFAVAKFRRVQFGQILYGGDDLGSDDWDHRAWNRHKVRRLLFDLAAEACLRL
ncbi:MAG: nucleoside phosphorylase [Candidatus Binataceae bacterium]